VAEHRGADGDVRGPDVAEREAGQPRGEPLRAVARERRPRAARAELLERVPRPGIAVAGAPQVDAVAARDEQRRGDRAEQVARQRRRCVLEEQ
jgi:hypothetical protein